MEIRQLQTRIQAQTVKFEEIQSKYQGEREVGRELRIENNTLKEELESIKTDSDSKQSRIEDLRSHIQRYINEVKRIEELLSLRERERSEILDQYKHLNDEAETSARNGRKLESKVNIFIIF
jgi:chromosome segregation ATPase